MENHDDTFADGDEFGMWNGEFSAVGSDQHKGTESFPQSFSQDIEVEHIW